MSAPSGVGIGLRRELAADVAACERQLDWLEIIPENFMGKDGPFSRALDRSAERFPIAAHGVAMNLAGPDPFLDEHTRLLKALLDRLGAPGFTEHLCWSKSHGHQSFDLLPLPFTGDAVRWVAGRVREVQDRLERRIAVENISTYALAPGGEMSEGAFHRAVCEEADCDLLLDVNNVYVNAINHHHDPLEHLLSFPLDRAAQMHLAGHQDSGEVCGAGTDDDRFLIDNHGGPVADPVWTLFEEAVRRCGPIPVLIEWDLNVPPLERVLDEADKARAIVSAVGAEAAA